MSRGGSPDVLTFSSVFCDVGSGTSSEVLTVSPVGRGCLAASFGESPSIDKIRARNPADELSSRITTSLPLRSLKLVCSGKSPCSVLSIGLPLLSLPMTLPFNTVPVGRRATAGGTAVALLEAVPERIPCSWA